MWRVRCLKNSQRHLWFGRRSKSAAWSSLPWLARSIWFIPMKKNAGSYRALKLLIPACAPMGTSVIATCTGSRDSESMWHWHPDNESEEAWQVLHNTLEQVLPVAEAAGVILAFEPEINNVASTVHKSRQLIDEMGSPNLKVVMDAAIFWQR